MTKLQSSPAWSIKEGMQRRSSQVSPEVVVTEPVLGESQGVLAARYAGFDSVRQRRFHCLLLASSAAFEIFYYEAVHIAEPLAENRAKAIFNSVDIPK